MILSLLLWLAGSLAAWSFVEYAAHRWFMHSHAIGFERRRESHALHHGAGWEWKARWAHYVDDGVSPAWNLVGSSPVWLLVGCYVSVLGAVVFAIVAFIHGCIWTWCHHRFHAPRGSWIENTWLFRTLRLHHFRHHWNPKTNYGALFGGVVDWIAGTSSSESAAKIARIKAASLGDSGGEPAGR
jgi:hypothetical protein